MGHGWGTAVSGGSNGCAGAQFFIVRCSGSVCCSFLPLLFHKVGNVSLVVQWRWQCRNFVEFVAHTAVLPVLCQLEHSGAHFPPFQLMNDC